MLMIVWISLRFLSFEFKICFSKPLIKLHPVKEGCHIVQDFKEFYNMISMSDNFLTTTNQTKTSKFFNQ